MVPILEQVSAALIDKVQVVKIDTEKYPAIADKYRIEALPTFILFKDGKPLDRFVSESFIFFLANWRYIKCMISLCMKKRHICFRILFDFIFELN